MAKPIKINQSDRSRTQFDRRAQTAFFAKLQFLFDKNTFYVCGTQIAKAESAEDFEKGLQR